MSHPTSNHSLSLLHSFLVVLIVYFCPLPCSLQLKHYFQPFYSGSPISAPSGTARHPNTSCTTLRTHDSDQPLSPCHIIPHALVFLIDEICAHPSRSTSTDRRPSLSANALHVSSRKPIDDSFVVHMSPDGTDNPF